MQLQIVAAAPYFHSGKVWDLDVAVQTMAEPWFGEALPNDAASEVVAFLDSLTGTLSDVSHPMLPPETATTPRLTGVLE